MNDSTIEDFGFDGETSVGTTATIAPDEAAVDYDAVAAAATSPAIEPEAPIAAASTVAEAVSEAPEPASSAPEPPAVGPEAGQADVPAAETPVEPKASRRRTKAAADKGAGAAAPKKRGAKAPAEPTIDDIVNRAIAIHDLDSDAERHALHDILLVPGKQTTAADLAKASLGDLTAPADAINRVLDLAEIMDDPLTIGFEVAKWADDKAKVALVAKTISSATCQVVEPEARSVARSIVGIGREGIVVLRGVKDFLAV